jgi:hypothetical protein
MSKTMMRDRVAIGSDGSAVAIAKPDGSGRSTAPTGRSNSNSTASLCSSDSPTCVLDGAS